MSIGKVVAGHVRAAISIAAAMLLLAGCGGGDGPDDPRVWTGPASDVTAASATLNLQVIPRGEPTEVSFFWGGDPDLAFDYAADFGAVGRGRDVVNVSMPVTGLAPNTTYYYRARASNDHRKQVDGAIRSFTTADDGSRYWARSWGTEGHGDTLHTIVFTADGGYVLAGKLGNSLGSEIWVIKFDATDQLEWRKTYSSLGLLEAFDIIETSDGNLLVAGTGPEPSLDSDLLIPYPLLVKIDATGNLLWAKRYSQFGSFKKLFGTPDQGAILFADFLIDLPAGGIEIDLGIYKVDRDGEVEWLRQLDSGEFDYFASATATASGYAAVGKSSLVPFSLPMPLPPWSFEVDVAGNLLWQEIYSCTFDPEEVRALPSGDLLVAGANESGGVLMQLDDDGDYQWMRTYADDRLRSIDIDAGGNILATGCFETGPGCGIGIAQLDAFGAPDWARTYAFVRRSGNPSEGSTRRIRYKPNGDLLFAGRYETRGNDLDAQVMLLPPDGDLGDNDSPHGLDDALAFCLETGASPLGISTSTATAIPMPLLVQSPRATAFQQVGVP